jgi:hypothetical protein
VASDASVPCGIVAGVTVVGGGVGTNLATTDVFGKTDMFGKTGGDASPAHPTRAASRAKAALSSRRIFL